MHRGNRYNFLKNLGVGFDWLTDLIDGLGKEYFTEDYPPYNIVKTDAETYVVQVSMTGYKFKNISAAHEKGFLCITAKAETAPEAADDVFFHRGIKDGDNYIKFPISPSLKYDCAVYDTGVLYVTYKMLKDGETATLIEGPIEIKDSLDVKDEELFKMLPDSGKVKFDAAGRARLRKRRMGFRRYMYDSMGRPVGVMDLDDPEKVDEEETKNMLKHLGKKDHDADKVAKDIAKKAEKVAEAKKKIEEEVAAPVVEKPAVAEKTEDKEVTVEVVAPENKPQIVEAKVTKKGDDKIDVEIKDATVEVSDDVVMKPVKTEKGKADVVVAVKKEEAEVLDEAKVDIAETVKEVVEALDSAPDLPAKSEKAEDKKTVLVDAKTEDKPTVEVTVPKEIPSVVEIKKDEKPTKADTPAIVVEDTAEDVSETAELIPVVTPAGNPDVVAAVEPEVKAELEEKGVDVKDVVEKAVAKVVEDVATVEPIDQAKVDEASTTAEVAAVEEKAAEEKVELVNKEEDLKSTVEVTNDIEEPVKVVEVKIDEENTEPVADEVKPVVIEDATVEVSDGAELSVVKTEDGKADIVVAATPEVKEELAKGNTTVEEIVEAVVEAPEITDAAPTITDDSGEKIEVEPEPVTIIVDKAVEDKPTVEVTTPDVVPQVVVAEVKENPEFAKEADVAVELKDTAEDVPEDATLAAVVTPDGQPDLVVAVPAEVENVEEVVAAVEKAVNQADVIVDAPADEEKVEEASAVEEVVEKLDEIAEEPATIMVDTEDETKPTVEVTLAAEESPQVVEVKIDENPSDPDVPAIVVEDATVEVSDTAELSVVKTEDGKADVVVAMEPEVKAELAAKDVVVEDVVKTALETNDAVPEVVDVEAAVVEAKVEEKVEEVVEKAAEAGRELPPEEVEVVTNDAKVEAEAELDAEPVKETTVLVDKAAEDKPTVEVTTAEVTPQVVVAEVDPEPANADIVSVDLKDAGDSIPEDAELVAVTTPEDQPDMIVAVTPEVKEAAEAAEVDIVEAVEKAVNVADVEVVVTDSTTVDEAVVEEAAAVEEVADQLKEIAEEPATILVNDMVEDKPTVEVTLEAKENPQIVEVVKDENPTSDAPAIVVKDATFEVESDTAEMVPVSTEEGKSDVVVAIEPELKTELEAEGVDVVEVVADAIETNDATPDIPEETAVAPAETVEVKSETNDAVAIEVEVPTVVSQIMEVEKDGDKVTLTDTSAEINPDAEVKAVVTQEGESDIAIVVDPQVEEELAAEGLDATTVVEEAVEKVQPAVETVVEVEVIEEPVAVEEPAPPTKPVVVVKKPGANT